MLYREIIAVCSQIHTKHIYTLCGQNVELYIKTRSVLHSKHTPSQIHTKHCVGRTQNLRMFQPPSLRRRTLLPSSALTHVTLVLRGPTLRRALLMCASTAL